jgi:hypothetical protein
MLVQIQLGAPASVPGGGCPGHGLVCEIPLVRNGYKPIGDLQRIRVVKNKLFAS